VLVELAEELAPGERFGFGGFGGGGGEPGTGGEGGAELGPVVFVFRHSSEEVQAERRRNRRRRKREETGEKEQAKVLIRHSNTCFYPAPVTGAALLPFIVFLFRHFLLIHTKSFIFELDFAFGTMAAFSSPAEDAINTTISLNTSLTGPSISPDSQSEKFDEYYEIVRTAGTIRKGGYKRVRATFSSLHHYSLSLNWERLGC
jgi:hypothetical protein